MGQAEPAVTLESKEASDGDSRTCRETVLRYVQPSRLSLIGWTVSVHERDEVRYDARSKRSDACRLESHDGKLAERQRNRAIPQMSTSMCADFPLGHGKNKHCDSHG